jgi:hypothetical protein
MPPLSPIPSTLPGARRLLASCLAVQQFELLMAQFAGPVERARWAELRSRVIVLPAAADSGEALEPPVNVMTRRVARLEKASAINSPPVSSGLLLPGLNKAGSLLDLCAFLGAMPVQVTPLQAAVLGLGDALQAVTLTANGGTVRNAERQGAHLEIFLHRAVWLTGI